MLRFVSDDTRWAIPPPAQNYLDYEDYMCHRWSPTVGSSMTTYPFKVWLDIIDIPPHLWSVDEILKGIASTGILLDHSPLHQITSFERFRILIATTHPRILKSITFLLQGVITGCKIKIIS
jgi:hypothetical protein